jgi:V/A-type H+/Na+-transporting ATPase subunit E
MLMPARSLETGKDKIQKICDVLRRETIEPAEADALKIVEGARKEAEQILKKAHDEAAEAERAARERIARERSVFASSVEQGIRQSLETLRQNVERKLFVGELGDTLATATGDPKVVASLINAIVEAIDREGIEAELTALVPKVVKVEEVNSLLLERVAKRLREGVQVGDFDGGARVRLIDRQITVDISDEALQELLGRFLRKDFRAVLFGKGV